MEGNADGAPPYIEFNLDSEESPFKQNGIVANPLSNDNCFIEIPALNVSSKCDHPVSIAAHPLQSVDPAYQVPEFIRLQSELVGLRLHVVQRHEFKPLALNWLD